MDWIVSEEYSDSSLCTFRIRFRDEHGSSVVTSYNQLGSGKIESSNVTTGFANQ